MDIGGLGQNIKSGIKKKSKKLLKKILVSVLPVFLTVACMGAVIGVMVEGAEALFSWLTGHSMTITELYDNVRDKDFLGNAWGLWKTESFKETKISMDSLQEIAKVTNDQTQFDDYFAFIPCTYYVFANDKLLKEKQPELQTSVSEMTEEKKPEGTKKGWKYYSYNGTAMKNIAGGVVSTYKVPWQFYYLTYLNREYDYDTDKKEATKFIDDLAQITSVDVTYYNDEDGSTIKNWFENAIHNIFSSTLGDVGLPTLTMDEVTSMSYVSEVKQFDSSAANSNVVTESVLEKDKKKTQNEEIETEKKVKENVKASKNGVDATEKASKTEKSEKEENKKNKHIFVYPHDRWYIPTAVYAETQYHAVPHNGTDIGSPGGTNIYASADGEVLLTDDVHSARVPTPMSTSYPRGMYVYQSVDAPGYEQVGILYQHCSEVLVKPGDHVKQGDLIARVGNSGSTGGMTGNHLHFEIDYGGFGHNVDPENYVKLNTPYEVVFADSYGGKPALGNGTASKDDVSGSGSDEGSSIDSSKVNSNPTKAELDEVWGQAFSNKLLAHAVAGDDIATEMNVKNSENASNGYVVDKMVTYYPTPLPKKIDWFLGTTEFIYTADGKKLKEVKTTPKINELNNAVIGIGCENFDYDFIMDAAKNIESFEGVGQLLENYRLQAKKGVYLENTRLTITVVGDAANQVQNGQELGDSTNASIYTDDASIDISSLDENNPKTFTGEDKHAQFIRMVGQCAHDYMMKAKKDGNPYLLPSVVIAQAITESGWGTSNICKSSNNYYGMNYSMYTYKHSPYDSWDNATKDFTTLQGELSDISSTEAFRLFTGVRESTYNYIGFAVWMKDNKGTSNMANAVVQSLKGDALKAADAVGESGYAMANGYGEALKRCINTYDLTRYDKDELSLKVSTNTSSAKGSWISVNDDGLSGLTATEINTYTNINTALKLDSKIKKDKNAMEDGDSATYNVTIKNCYESIALPSSAGGMGIPYYCQTDSKFASLPYGSGNNVGDVNLNDVLNNGCGPTSIAMIVSYFKQRQWTPADYLNKYGNEGYVSGMGLSHSMPGKVASDFGIKCKTYEGQAITAEVLVTELKKGHPMIVAVRGGAQRYFTSGGHYIVLRGLKKTSSGAYMILVNDPNDGSSRKHYSKAYGPQFIVQETCGNIAFSFYN